MLFFPIGFFSFPDVFQQHGHQRADHGHGQSTAFGPTRHGPRVGGEKPDLSGTGSGTDIRHVLGHVVLQDVPRVLAKVEKVRPRTSRAGKSSQPYPLLTRARRFP